MEAAIALAVERDTLPGVTTMGGGGFLTAATCFGGALVRRLKAAGVELTVTSQ